MDRRGTIWLWAVAILTIVTITLLWFVTTWPLTILIGNIESQYTFPSEVQPAVSLMKAVIAWFLIFMAFGLLLWIAVNSQRKEGEFPL